MEFIFKESTPSTIVYFVRHSISDKSYRGEDSQRPLTPKGKELTQTVIRFLDSKAIDALYTSPYLRCVDTLAPFAQGSAIPLGVIEDLRERKIGEWIEDFTSFAQRQWADFTYRLPHGEHLQEVQQRNIAALTEVLQRHPGETLAIGTHGTALSTIIHYYDNSYDYEEFSYLRPRTPHVILGEFVETELVYWEHIELV